MNVPSGIERRHVLLAGASIAVLVTAVLLFTSGSDERGVGASTSGTGADAAPAPVVPSGETAAPAAQQAAAPASSAGAGASARGRSGSGADSLAPSLEAQLARSMPPPPPSTKPGVAPRPSGDVKAAATLLRGWQARWESCLRATRDFRDCDISTPAGVRLANVTDMGATYSLTAVASDGTVVTLASVRGIACRSTSRTPRDCDAWR